MIRKILVPLDPSPYTDSALQTTCYLAKLHDAEVTGVSIIDISDVAYAATPNPVGYDAYDYPEYLVDYNQKMVHEYIGSLLEKFEEKCKRERIKYGKAEYQGMLSDEILRESMYYDLVVLGLRTHFWFDDTEKPGQTLTELLGHSVTPLVAVPDNFKFGEEINVLIAFDGSMPAGRALQRFATMAIADRVNVVLLSAHKEEQEAAYYLKRANYFLDYHGFKGVKTVWTSERIIKVLQDDFLQKSDLVVLGAHSHSKLHDFVAGSLTKFLIEDASTPIMVGF